MEKNDFNDIRNVAHISIFLSRSCLQEIIRQRRLIRMKEIEAEKNTIGEASSKKSYTVEDCVNYVKLGLTPSEALRACNNPCSKQYLSTQLSKSAEIAATKDRNCDKDKDCGIVEVVTVTDSSTQCSSLTQSQSIGDSLGSGSTWWVKKVKQRQDESAESAILFRDDADAVISINTNSSDESIDLNTSK